MRSFICFLCEIFTYLYRKFTSQRCLECSYFLLPIIFIYIKNYWSRFLLDLSSDFFMSSSYLSWNTQNCKKKQTCLNLAQLFIISNYFIKSVICFFLINIIEMHEMLMYICDKFNWFKKNFLDDKFCRQFYIWYTNTLWDIIYILLTGNMIAQQKLFFFSKWRQTNNHYH